MSGQNSDQLHRSTMGIYTNIMEQFNPGLQKLVALGSSYIQAFQVLTVTSEAYFNALAKMGEQAMQSMSSRLLGDVLIQISENQRRLTSELEGVFRWFHSEVLQEMEHNIRLDKEYISASRRQYEMEVRNQVTAYERQMRRGVPQDGSEYGRFLREGQKEALKEEERRYRFLAEKHSDLTQSIACLMNKTGGSLQSRSEGWKDLVNHTRESRPRTPSRLDDNVFVDSINRSAEPFGRAPSRGPSPQPSRSNSVYGFAGGRVMRALASHPAPANSTLLPFNRGELISLLVKEPRNGWLYGRCDSSGRQGWFPAAYVGPADEPPGPPAPSSLGSTSSSTSNLFDQSVGSSHYVAPPPPPPPPLSTKSSASRPVTPTPSEIKRQENSGSRPELFPRGTNPFATVKLKPTKTNDRSAPHV